MYQGDPEYAGRCCCCLTDEMKRPPMMTPELTPMAAAANFKLLTQKFTFTFLSCSIASWMQTIAIQLLGSLM
jgi:hypothetical protein